MTAHMSLTEIEPAAGRSFADFALVCVERDPFAKIICPSSHMNVNLAGYARDGQRRNGRARARRGGDAGPPDHAWPPCPPKEQRYVRPAGHRACCATSISNTTWPRSRKRWAFRRRRCRTPNGGPLSNSIDPAALFRRDQIDWINDYFAEEIAAFGYAPR